MKFNYFFILIIVFLNLSCKSTKKEHISNIDGTIMNDSIYFVDLDVEEEKNPILFSTIFNKVETIILETRNDALITQLFELQAFDDYIFILNQQNPRNFMIFDRTGKFIRKIGGIGQGPGEYVRVYDFTIDPDNKVIFLNCDLVINKYKIDGTFLGAIQTGGHSTQIQFCNGKLYLDGLGGYLIRELDPETGKQTFQYLDVKQYNKGYMEPLFKFGGGPFKYRSNESPKFVHTFMDTIMAIQPYGIIPFLAITSNNLTTNADIADTKELIQNERIESIRNKNKIFCINLYFETKNHIGFSYIYGKNLIYILYDRQNKSYKKGKFRNDLVFDGKRQMQNIKYSDANGVYESFHEGFTLDYIYGQIQNGGLSLNLDKRDEIMKLPEDTNPVIFYYSY